ncbi:hypothetical protein [Qipengyuania sp. MTN3-11]|uniref:hypothetical protein n=1 Tax=Qipengyuania sp. MTN3-11 TaxID=3056557 RepID=UPI0036F2C612
MEWMIGFAPFLMVMFIVWTVSRSKLESKRISATATETAEKAAQYSSRVQQLEDRVRVLERIVTDRGYDVATQIEALRDSRAVEGHDAGVPLDMTRKEKV